MICFDEFGPLEVRPQPGTCWEEKGKTQRQPATYTRTQGVMHLLAALDLKEDHIYAHRTKRKRWIEVRQFFKYLRSLYPMEERLYIVMDNFSPHKKAEVLQYMTENNMEPVFTATNASWMNRIECHFGSLRYFAIKNSNYKDHRELGSAIRRYLIWRNNHPKDPQIVRHQKRIKLSA